jgi:DnaJ-class molecular chaperone
VLGDNVSIKTVQGSVTMTIPPGTSSGTTLRLKGKGKHEKGEQGDHYITIAIAAPKQLTKQQRTLYEALRDCDS